MKRPRGLPKGKKPAASGVAKTSTASSRGEKSGFVVKTQRMAAGMKKGRFTRKGKAGATAPRKMAEVEEADEDEGLESDVGDVSEEMAVVSKAKGPLASKINGTDNNSRDDNFGQDDEEEDDQDDQNILKEYDYQEEQSDDDLRRGHVASKTVKSPSSPASASKSTSQEDDESTGTLSKVNGFIVLPVTMPPLNFFPSQPNFMPFTKHISKDQAEKLTSPVPVVHQLLFRLHSTKASDAHIYPKGRTLFLCNVPSDASERHFRRLFRRCGPVERVMFSKRGVEGSVGPSGGHAHVVFYEEEAAQRAIIMKPRKRNWSAILEEGMDESEIPYMGEGLDKWVAMHQSSYPPLDQLEAEVNEYMQKFEEMEEEKERQLAMRRNQPDEDGFILVTKGAGRKGKAASEAAMDKRDRKPKKKQMVDFYSFQMRETKRNQLAELRKKFAEDKTRLEMMKAKRKFKPY
ncbi:Ribosomal RNA-processing protein 7 A [Dinochytrium kinnereticum]|nr:Ribosomal RNA-processing protein 7 A [Dinochytrium kinnereticum]